jgi:hypothetical protein
MFLGIRKAEIGENVPYRLVWAGSFFLVLIMGPLSVLCASPMLAGPALCVVEGALPARRSLLDARRTYRTPQTAKGFLIREGKRSSRFARCS